MDLPDGFMEHIIRIMCGECPWRPFVFDVYLLLLLLHTSAFKIHIASGGSHNSSCDLLFFAPFNLHIILTPYSIYLHFVIVVCLLVFRYLFIYLFF
eukprot:gene4336-3150_t